MRGIHQVSVIFWYERAKRGYKYGAWISSPHLVSSGSRLVERLSVSLPDYQATNSSTMHSVVVFLAVLVGAAVASPMILSPDDVKQQNRDISATEYLKRIFEHSPKLLYSPIDVSSQGDVIDMLPALGLNEAALIAEQVNLRQILLELSSVTLCLPTDEAVRRWREELPNTLKPDLASLKQLVKAWIIPGMIRSTDISNNQKVQSLNGAKLRFNVYNEVKKIVTVNGARIIDADKMASNGIIQVVDKVIFPLPVGNVIETVVDNQAFSIIVDLLKQAGLEEELQVSDPVTVLVPTNSAFRALPSGVLDDLKREKSKLQNLLKYHVISDIRYSASLSSGQRIMASQGDEISVSIENGKIILNKAQDRSEASRVIQADIPTTNGVIHVIDQVLIPSQKHYVLV
ncbi:transforming growth factor-beta-induced protein ig-h3 isoform X2 [Strongylocentrotus purpuratus]|uniref:FAS1 domain-containing protein n=1 Tax=Strongylocentrotus purpuratus TaxID=7668 RepID=A0A7M7G0S7_STRPU|nr:transforming growth factor-beta-induced protein ig-h3 isoform X2 [Strongylocentrotus purpuratus]